MSENVELEEIIAGIDDLSDPECMDRIIIYLEKLQEEDEEFMTLLVEKLKNEVISWEQPWYQHAFCLTRPLQNIEADGIQEPFRTDSISEEESKQVDKNWHRFRKRFNMPDKLVCFARWRNKDKSRNPKTPEEKARQFVTAYLAQGLERNLYQVYQYILSHYGGRVKGPYSETEEKIMEICFVHNPRNAATHLSAVLGRHPRGIYKRMQQLYDGGKPDKKRLKWTLPLATKFVRLLMDYSGHSLNDLKYKKFDKSVWLRLQQDFDQHYVYLQLFWYTYLHVQLFVKYDVKLKRLLKKIFMILRSSSYQVWSDIRWKEILKHFPDGFTHRFLYKVAYAMVRLYPRRHLKPPLEEIIEYVMEKLNKQHRRLKTLALNQDGMLEIVKHDLKLP